LRDSLEKTGRRLTSDPIRTSLGLLPSGPDPVGEWLVHRQSPGAYLGPKGPESKRGGTALGAPEHPNSVMAGHSRLKDGVASARRCRAIHVWLFSLVRKKTWMPGIKPGMTGVVRRPSLCDAQ
jgi:hypothetical protein